MCDSIREMLARQALQEKGNLALSASFTTRLPQYPAFSALCGPLSEPKQLMETIATLEDPLPFEPVTVVVRPRPVYPPSEPARKGNPGMAIVMAFGLLVGVLFLLFRSVASEPPRPRNTLAKRETVPSQPEREAQQAFNERARQQARLLEANDQEAVRKFQQAVARDQNGAGEVEQLYQEAIASWETLLPQTTSPEHRKFALARLALAYLVLGEHCQRKGQPAGAESALQQSIRYGEQAAALDPERPLIQHRLDLARQLLEQQREQPQLEEINKLWTAERYAECIAVCRRAVQEQEERVRSGQDRQAANRCLAGRLDQLARRLAHCPDNRVRDTEEAVQYARRATRVQPDGVNFWFTLSLVQYRNGDFRDSLAALDQVRIREGGLNACGWFLAAMNLQQLNRGQEARTAFRRGLDWIEERQQEGKKNPRLRIQYETIRSGIDLLRQEAERLLEGKDSSGWTVSV